MQTVKQVARSKTSKRHIQITINHSIHTYLKPGVITGNIIIRMYNTRVKPMRLSGSDVTNMAAIENNDYKNNGRMTRLI